MNWIELNSLEQLEEIKVSESPSIIFKHSTRCSVSNMVIKMFQKEWDEQTPVKLYYLDLLEHRNISNQIAEDFNIEHESPQVLMINASGCIYDASHQSISANQIATILQNNL